MACGPATFMLPSRVKASELSENTFRRCQSAPCCGRYSHTSETGGEGGVDVPVAFCGTPAVADAGKNTAKVISCGKNGTLPAGGIGLGARKPRYSAFPISADQPNGKNVVPGVLLASLTLVKPAPSNTPTTSIGG